MKNIVVSCSHCDWIGCVKKTVFCGSVGPLCPECHEVIIEEYIIANGKAKRIADIMLSMKDAFEGK